MYGSTWYKVLDTLAGARIVSDAEALDKTVGGIRLLLVPLTTMHIYVEIRPYQKGRQSPSHGNTSTAIHENEAPLLCRSRVLHITRCHNTLYTTGVYPRVTVLVKSLNMCASLLVLRAVNYCVERTKRQHIARHFFFQRCPPIYRRKKQNSFPRVFLFSFPAIKTKLPAITPLGWNHITGD